MICRRKVDIEIEVRTKMLQLLMDSFLVGIEMIADEFPEYIRVEESNGLG